MHRHAILVFAFFVAFASSAHAQYGVPAQGPPLDPQGTLRLLPTLGVVHDAEFDTTGAAIMVRGRYALLDEFAVAGHFGGTLGEIDDFQLGVGGKFELLTRDAGFPIDLTGFTEFDLGFGDTTLFSWLSGPLVSYTFDVADLALTPYTGVGLGFTRFGDGIRGNDISNSTELALGFIFGADAAISRDLSTFTELTFGVTDGLPSLNWHFGVSYAILTPPEWRAAGNAE